jgi:hypothetical protein
VTKQLFGCNHPTYGLGLIFHKQHDFLTLFKLFIHPATCCILMFPFTSAPPLTVCSFSTPSASVPREIPILGRYGLLWPVCQRLCAAPVSRGSGYP